jgi:hypothetical protein
VTDIYLDYERYNKLIDALLNMKPCPFAGVVTADQIKLALGLGGDIWPATILPDVLAEDHRTLCHSRNSEILIAISN